MLEPGCCPCLLPHPRSSTPQKIPREHLSSPSLQLWKSLTRVERQLKPPPRGRSKSSIPGTSPGLVLTPLPSFSPPFMHARTTALLSQAGMMFPGGVSQNALAPQVHLNSHRKVNKERGKKGICSQAPSHHRSFSFRGVVDLSCTPQLCMSTRWVSTSPVWQCQLNLLGQDMRA